MKWLGIPSDILNYHIRKHHFSVKSLKYLSRTGKFVTTPISRREVVTEGLQDSVESFRKKQYIIVPNTSFYNATLHSPIMSRRHQQLRERTTRLLSFKSEKESTITLEQNQFRKMGKEGNDISTEILQQADNNHAGELSKKLQSDENNFLATKSVQESTPTLQQNQFREIGNQVNEISTDILQQADNKNAGNISNRLPSDKSDILGTKTTQESTITLQQNNFREIGNEVTANTTEILQQAGNNNVGIPSTRLQSDENDFLVTKKDQESSATVQETKYRQVGKQVSETCTEIFEKEDNNTVNKEQVM